MVHPAAAVLCLTLLTPVTFDDVASGRAPVGIALGWREADPGAVSRLRVTARSGTVPRGLCVVRARRERDNSVRLDVRTDDSAGPTGGEFARSTSFSAAEYPLREHVGTANAYANGHLTLREGGVDHRPLRVWDVTIDRWLMHPTSVSITEYDGAVDDPAHVRTSVTCEPGVG